MQNKCLICEDPAPYTWFCRPCTEAKEKYYAECREKGIDNWIDIMIGRDKAMTEAYKLRKQNA